MSGFDIGKKHIGDGAPCYIIAEVAQAHEGSLNAAVDYVRAIASTGADAAKFQCHIAEAESTPEEPWRILPRSPQDASRYDYWKRTGFTGDEWAWLAGFVRGWGLEFLCSPFSVEAVKLLDPHVKAWKVPSGEIANQELLAAIGTTKKPAILSSGLSSWREFHDAAVFLRGFAPVALMQCMSAYPCPPEYIGLPTAAKWRGLSDHSGTIYAGLAAVALGCDVLEVHVKLSEYDNGPDASSSITIPQLKQLVEGIRFIEKAKQPVDKDALAKELEPMRRLFMDKHKRRTLAVEI